MNRAHFKRRSAWLPAVSLLACLRCTPAAADISGKLRDALWIGSRPDLGLGGDPFLSLALGESGWWNIPRERAAGLSSRRYAPITRRLTGSRSELLSSETTVFIREHRDVKGWLVSGEVNGQSRDRDHMWISDDANLLLDERGSTASGSVHIQAPFPNVSWKMEFPLARAPTRSANVPFTYGLQGILRDRLWVAQEWRSGSYGVPFDAFIAGDLVHASANLEEEAIHSLARARIWRGLAVEISYRESSYTPSTHLTDEFRDEFLPDGWFLLRQQSIEWRGVAGRCDVIARHTDVNFNGRANGYWGGQRYLRLSHGSTHLNGWLAAAQARFGRDRMQLEVQTSEVAGFGRADIEGWRFGSSDFFGGKQVVQGGGDGLLQRFRIGYETNRPWGRLRGGITWYELYPSVELESWIKIIFVREDYERHTLASDRYSLAALSFGGETELLGLCLGFGLHQFVHYDDHLKPPGDPPGEPGEPSDRLSGWYGGTFLELSLARRF